MTIPIVTPIPNKEKPIEGNKYYFLKYKKDDKRQLVSGSITIHEGTCFRCKKCKKACIANAHQVSSFGNTKELLLPVNIYLNNPLELTYNEESGMALCENCN